MGIFSDPCCDCGEKSVFLHTETCDKCGRDVCSDCYTTYKINNLPRTFFDADLGICNKKTLVAFEGGHPISGGRYHFCRGCNEIFKRDIELLRNCEAKADEYVEVVSINYRGRVKPYKSFEIISTGYDRDRNYVIHLAKVQAMFKGYKRIIDFEIIRETEEEESESGHGIHYYSVWKVEGLAVD